MSPQAEVSICGSRLPFKGDTIHFCQVSWGVHRCLLWFNIMCRTPPTMSPANGNISYFFYYFFIESHGTRLSEHPGLQREDHHYVSPSVCPCVDSWWWRLWPELSQAREAVGTLRRATETWTIWDLTRSQVMLTALIILVLTRPANCSIYSAGQSMRATPSKREIYIYISVKWTKLSCDSSILSIHWA